MSARTRHNRLWNVSRFFYVVFMFGAFSLITAEENVFILRRATSRSLTIQIPCIKNDTCSVSRIYYGEDGSEDMDRIWGINVMRLVNDSEDASMDLRSLKPGTTYVVRAFWGLLDPEDQMTGYTQIKTSTCGENLPAVSGVRVVKAGPGWIDLRWTPLRDENCYSDIIYYVRYKVKDGSAGEWAHFGVYFVEGVEVFRPTHPCAGWPGEFCVLLTDRVKPGAIHDIEVVGVRYDAAEFKKNQTLSFPPAQVARATAVSDAMLQGAYTWGERDNHTPCAPPPRPPPPSSRDVPPAEIQQPSRTGVSTPVWALVLSAVVLLAVILAASIALWRWSRRKEQAPSGLLRNPTNLHASPPDVCQSSNPPSDKFQQSRPLPTPSRVSNIYDDCVDTSQTNPVYDRLCEPPSTFKLQPPAKKPIAATRNVPAPKLQNLPGAEEPALGTLPTLSPAQDDNQYVPMGPPPPLYDDAGDVLTRNDARSSDYVPPRTLLPTYIEVTEPNAATPGYNRPYSTMTSKWKAWT